MAVRRSTQVHRGAKNLFTTGKWKKELASQCVHRDRGEFVPFLFSKLLMERRLNNGRREMNVNVLSFIGIDNAFKRNEIPDIESSSPSRWEKFVRSIENG